MISQQPHPSQRHASHRYGGIVALAMACPLLLSACANLSGPAYQRPETASKDNWSTAADEVQPKATATQRPLRSQIEPQWWKAFRDPYLSQLIEQAIDGNLDIRVLAARIGVARAAIGQARAGLLPTVSGGAGTDTFKDTGSASSTQYSVAAEVGWEIDIWGKLRKGVDAQQAEYKATEADWRAGYLNLVSDVATAYFQIRRFDEQTERLQLSLERSRKTLAIFEAMHGEGLIPNTQVLQQRAEINRLENTRLELARLRKVTENGLATLLGMPADSLQVPAADKRVAILPVTVPAGLPADLLARRPDIIAAEYRVMQAYNLEGQARLARLPSLSLTGRGGTAAFALADLFRTGTFGLSSLLSLPIFDPNVTARIDVSEAQTQVAREEYRRTVIRAFEDVENALTNLSSRKAQALALGERRDQLALVSEQTNAQLREGMVSQLEVFEVERTLLDAEQTLLANHWQTLADTIALFKALGGGWPAEDPQKNIGRLD